MSDTPTPLSDQLRESVRRAKDSGMTYREIAERAAMHPTRLSDWLSGRRTITLETADRLASACAQAQTK